VNEIGGDFHWMDLPSGPFLEWPEPYRLFSTARTAIVSLAKLLGKSKLWLPVYFCPHTASCWQGSGLEIAWYVDHPLCSQPDWMTLTPQADDLVIAVNYFGVRSAKPWQDWKATHPDIMLLEDHTHDPLSGWARNSKADYGFASLRKTLPIPDGAIVWSPVSRALPPEPTGQNWTGSALKLAAMIWKKQYIDSGETALELKALFRRFQIEGEEELSKYTNQQLSPWSYALLKAGIPADWRNKREENVRYCIDRVPESKYVRPLFNIWPEDHCPFNSILITDTLLRRDELRQCFINSGIYPPIHWQLPEDISGIAQDIACRVLTLPLDYRCTPTDIDRIIMILKDYLTTL
jgi:hypothetical protein